jgi:hypothetical protein
MFFLFLKSSQLISLFEKNRNQNGSENFAGHIFRRELHPESFPIQRLLGETLKV